MYLCNITKSEKSVPSVQQLFLRPCNKLQRQNEVHAIVLLNCFVQWNSQFLASLQHHEWKEHETQTLG